MWQEELNHVNQHPFHGVGGRRVNQIRDKVETLDQQPPVSTFQIDSWNKVGTLNVQS